MEWRMSLPVLETVFEKDPSVALLGSASWQGRSSSKPEMVTKKLHPTAASSYRPDRLQRIVRLLATVHIKSELCNRLSVVPETPLRPLHTIFDDNVRVTESDHFILMDCDFAILR